jgi:hypothetical protein
MDYSLIGLIGLIAAVLLVGVRTQRRWRPGGEGYEYQRVISAAVFGLAVLVAGFAGLDIGRLHGWFQGARWMDGPVWWEIGLGAALLTLAVHWARHARPSAVARRPSA